MDVEQVTLGQRIKERRKILNITQQQLAESLGLTAQHISAIEQGKWSPSLAVLPRMAEALGVSTDYLLSGKEGLITDVIPAIKADKTLSLKVKQALISLIEEQRSSSNK